MDKTMRGGEGNGAPERPVCGNCCNAMKHPDPSRAIAGVMICTALPPTVFPAPGPGGQLVGRNVYPEMDPAKLGCTVLWGVQFSLWHLIAQAAAATLEELEADDSTPPGG